MSNGPKMYIAPGLEDEYKKEFLKQCESRTYEICYDRYSFYLLTPLSFN